MDPKVPGECAWTFSDVFQHPPTSRFSLIFGHEIAARLVNGMTYPPRSQTIYSIDRRH